MTNPVTAIQGMPQQSTPLIDPDGTMNQAWYRFFLALYNNSRMGQDDTPLLAYRQPSGGAPHGALRVYNPLFPGSYIAHGGLIILSAP